MKDVHFDTSTVHASGHNNVKSVSKVKPIYQTSAFSFSDLDDLEDYFRGKNDFLYTRMNNPNQDDFAKGVAQLEQAPSGVVTSSGISAILIGILSVAQAGDHIVACQDLYGGTYQLLSDDLKSFGIETSFVSFNDSNEIEKNIRPNTKLLYSESVTNPLLRVEDLGTLVEIAKKHNLTTMIDNTFATPFVLQPFTQGIDLVVHSATKYLNGHSDVTAGVVVGREDLVAKAKSKMVHLGCNLGPFDAWLASRGLKTLSVRMERHVANAKALAEELKDTKGIKKVYYPEFVSEKGNGAIVSIELDENCDVHAFFKSLDWVHIVPTLAGVETTVSYPLGTSHRSLPAEMCEALGINKNVIRISVGIENAEDIIEVFKTASHKALGL
ncbi:trans-sulfuration enzyme family protein [Fictibacillus phosphorivorans]|uniref:trans-sulfuration enzyme family protein n=1 Tax=Fictibacillus phosphorivorans TaxID=1221500 RepID=UPI00203A736C|nr:PLP-dependent aspartate aminotransferase family protein [Fictibacillus phosphorivorans]MCM3719846.1 PLP-dependent aspartate aminotransferase family protein [Fictibacillus phosphorivorans]MCM3777484.1 PLP-dependent aspartate aminotransferase family protein [Fictibacillus phosphorivorans]